MDKGFYEEQSKYSIERYFSICNISELTQKKLSTSDISILPTQYADDEFYFAQESINFAKYCCKANKEINTSILADDNRIEVRALHSFDIWMPIIFVATSVMLPIAVNLVSDYIFLRMKGREKDDCTVKVTFIVQRGKEKKELHYNGDAKTFKDTFEKIDINKI